MKAEKQLQAKVPLSEQHDAEQQRGGDGTRVREAMKA